MCLAESSCNKSQSGQLRLAVTDANTPQSLNARLSELFGAPPFNLNPEIGQSSSSSWSCSSSTQWASVAGKAPDLPATILFRWFNGEILGFSRTKDDDEYPGKARLFWVRHEHIRGRRCFGGLGRCGKSKQARWLAWQLWPISYLV